MRENSDMLRELNAFDPQFFEELEDLKFAYREVRVACFVVVATCTYRFAAVGDQAQ